VSKKPIKSDLERIDRMTDADIDYSDIPELDERAVNTDLESDRKLKTRGRPAGEEGASERA
jgi:hypothetical protein